MGVDRGAEGGVAAAGGDGDGEGVRVFADQAAASGFSSFSGSSSSLTLRSPASSSLTDDGGEVTSTSPRNGGGGDSSFLSLESELESEEEMMQLDGDEHADGGGGPLYELAAPLVAQLPLRTGLSKYYQGKSQSFTSLCNARCVEDLAKKTTPYITRMKLQLRRGLGVVVADRSSNSRHAPVPCSKTMAKKTPRCSLDRLLSTARSTSLFTAAAAAQHLHTRARKSCQDTSYKKAIQATAKWRGGFSPEMNSSAISTLLHWS